MSMDSIDILRERWEAAQRDFVGLLDARESVQDKLDDLNYEIKLARRDANVAFELLREAENGR